MDVHGDWDGLWPPQAACFCPGALIAKRCQLTLFEVVVPRFVGCLCQQGTDLEILKQSSRLVHYCATPLLFDPVFRKQIQEEQVVQPPVKVGVIFRSGQRTHRGPAGE